MLTISVCIGSACHLKGSYNVINTFQQLIEEYKLSNQVELKAVFCMKHCVQAVSVMVEDQIYSVSGPTARSFFEKELLPRVQAT